MNLKIICTLGLILITISQMLLAQGANFIFSQSPVDFAHWSMLLGSILLLEFDRLFPKSILNTIAKPMTILGIAAHVGMCMLDFILWSYGDEVAKRDELIWHLMNIPVIWYPFLVVGPSLFYIGLSLQAWYFIRTHTLAALMAIIGGSVIGYGQFMGGSRMIVVIGCTVFSIGLIMLIFRKQTE